MKHVLLAILLSVAAPVCAQKITSTPIASAADSPATIHFQAGDVQRDGGKLRVHWEASGAGNVTVVASGDPDRITDGVTLGQGGESGALETALEPRRDGKRWFIHLTPARGSALVLAERYFKLATAPNFRDLGGYRTTDGRWVRMGLLFRSDQLNLLSDADLARIAATGVGAVADLRTGAERSRDPDRVPANARQLVFDMAGDQDPAPFMAALARGEARAAMTGIYKQFPSSSATAAALNGLLATIKDANVPVLFHCTAGKDRTGWASAVLLSLLGVPRHTVIEDYLASTSLLADKNARILAVIQPPFTAEQLRPVLTVDRAFIAASFDEVDRRYGSMEDYAKVALGLDAKFVAKLRAQYLAGAPTG